MKIYIAGPTTGHDGYRERFAEAKGYLYLRKSWPENLIVNPVELVDAAYPDGDCTWEEAMAVDIPELAKCSHAYFLRGWEKSDGARLEMGVCLTLGIKLFMED